MVFKNKQKPIVIPTAVKEEVSHAPQMYGKAAPMEKEP